MEKIAAALSRKAAVAPALAPNDDLPTEYWQALLEDAGAQVAPTGSSMAALRLTENPEHGVCGNSHVGLPLLFIAGAVWQDEYACSPLPISLSAGLTSSDSGRTPNPNRRPTFS